jgi:hypothetical protein
MFGILSEEPIAHIDIRVQADDLRKQLKKQQKKLKSLETIRAKVERGESIDTDQRVKLKQHEAVQARVLAYSEKLKVLEAEIETEASAAKKMAEDRLDAVNHVLDAIDDKFLCPICQECLETATTTTCGHTFCRACILASTASTKACPMCRAPLQADGLKPAKTLRKRMAKIKRVCHCQEEVSLSAIRAHLRTCSTIQRIDDIFAQPSSSPSDKNTPLSLYHSRDQASEVEQQATASLRDREEALIQEAIALSMRDFERSN